MFRVCTEAWTDLLTMTIPTLPFIEIDVLYLQHGRDRLPDLLMSKFLICCFFKMLKYQLYFSFKLTLEYTFSK